MNKVISFPVDLAEIYSSAKQVDRMGLLIDAFGGLTRFFNLYCAQPIEKLINEDLFNEYKVGYSDDDDSIVYSRVVRQCERNSRIEEEKFNSHHLDILGVSLSDLRSQSKAMAVYLIECALETVVDHIHGESEDQGGQLDSLTNLTASHEIDADRSLPVTIVLEAEILINLVY